MFYVVILLQVFLQHFSVFFLQLIALLHASCETSLELLGHAGLLAGRIHTLHLSEATVTVRGAYSYYSKGL